MPQCIYLYWIEGNKVNYAWWNHAQIFPTFSYLSHLLELEMYTFGSAILHLVLQKILTTD